MKKTKYIFAAVVVAAALGSLSSCKEKLKEVDGKVADVEIYEHIHTPKCMKLYDGNDTLLFGLKDAEYNNGIMMEGDSVQVYYVKGHGDTLRAMLVYVKPRPPKVIDITKDTTQVLLTR